MPAPIIDQTEPYIAANGHTMTAPVILARDGSERPVAAWAECVAECPACAAGGDPNDYAGEEW